MTVIAKYVFSQENLESVVRELTKVYGHPNINTGWDIQLGNRVFLYSSIPTQDKAKSLCEQYHGRKE